MSGKPGQGCDEYGRLSWETAQNICPDGWHLPSDEEWNALIAFYGGDIKEKNKTKINELQVVKCQ